MVCEMEMMASQQEGAHKKNSTANVAHTRQSRPESGRGFQVISLGKFEGVASSLEGGKPDPSGVKNRRNSRSK